MTWPNVPLEELCAKIGSGATPRGGNKSYKQSGITLVRSMNVHLGRFKRDNLAFIDEEQGAKLSNVVLEPDDVLLNITGASVARCCTMDNSVLPARVNQHVCILRPKPSKLNFQYLMCFLTSAQTQRVLLGIAGAGATREAITKTEILKFQIPLPPLEEQKRIAAILDAADGLRAKRRESLAQLDTLLQSTFLDLFGDPVTNPKEWEKLPLGDVTVKITDGNTLNPEFSHTGMPIVMAGNVLETGVDIGNAKRVEYLHGEKFRRKCAPEEGDILLVSRGATIGRMCAVGSTDPFCLMGSVILVKPLEGKVDPAFLSGFLRHPATRTALYKTSGSSAQQAIYIKDVRKLVCIIPPYDTQRRFADIVTKVEAQKARLRAHLTELDTLFASLQSRAFRGEL